MPFRETFFNLNETPQPGEHVQVMQDKWTTVGDMHGNPLKLLHILVKVGALKFKDHVNAAQVYSDFKNFYDVYDGSKGLDETKSAIDSLLHNLEKNPEFTGGVRLLGDLLCDRGKNDLFILALLAKLDDVGVPKKIILSNHDMWFIYSMEIFFRGGSLQLPAESGGREDQVQSLQGLIELFDSITNEQRKEEFKEELKELYRKYIADLVLIDLEINEGESPVIFTHAPITPNVLNDMAGGNGLLAIYDDLGACNTKELKECMARENATVRSQVLIYALHLRYRPDMINFSMYDGDINQTTYFYQCLWMRKPSPQSYPPIIDGQFMNIHGHDGNSIPCATRISLDCWLGMPKFLSSDNNTGNLPMYISPGSVRQAAARVEDRKTVPYHLTAAAAAAESRHSGCSFVQVRDSEGGPAAVQPYAGSRIADQGGSAAVQNLLLQQESYCEEQDIPSANVGTGSGGQGCPVDAQRQIPELQDVNITAPQAQPGIFTRFLNAVLAPFKYLINLFIRKNKQNTNHEVKTNIQPQDTRAQNPIGISDEQNLPPFVSPSPLNGSGNLLRCAYGATLRTSPPISAQKSHMSPKL